MIPPGRHGGDGAAVAASLGLDPGDVLDLSATLNPWAPDLGPILARRAGSVRRYPDRTAAAGALADAVATDVSRVLITNGGSEAISLVARAIGGGVTAEPEFSLHPRCPEGPRWRSDPHSPSGTLAGPGEHADVWDEAFYPLATGSWTAGPARGAGAEGLVTVGSLTKVFACPGLRLGYIIADDVDRFARLQHEWPVGTLALDVLVDLLGMVDLSLWCSQIAEHRRGLVQVLAEHGLAAEPSDAPWLLVRAPGLRERLARQGVVVRDCTSFGLPGWARIAVPDGEGLARLDLALRRSAP